MRAEVEGNLSRYSSRSSEGGGDPYAYSARGKLLARTSSSSPTAPTGQLQTNSGLNSSDKASTIQEDKPKTSTLGLRDELDERAYQYALRVGHINNVLYRAFTQPQSRSKQAPRTYPSSPSVAASTPGGTSAASSYFLQTPGSPSTSFATTISNGGSPLPSPGMSVKEDVAAAKGPRASFWGGKKKKGPVDEEKDPGKLPKEFLVNFWDVLGSEGGDTVWRTSVNTFISHLPSKRATKTASGLNLREVPTLLEAFSSTLPTQDPSVPRRRSGSASPPDAPANHHHQEHLLSLLLSSLQSWYSPMGKNAGEKDREMHARLKAEIEGYCLPGGEASAAAAHGEAMPTDRPRSLKRGSSNASMAPPSPGFNGDVPPVPAIPGRKTSRRNDGHIDLVEVVGRVFGVGRNRLERDLDGLKRGGIDERSYLSDLKLHLATLNATDAYKSSRTTQDRIVALQTEIGNLLQACPQLNTASMTPQQPSANDLYFTPASSPDSVYDRLVERVYLMLGAQQPPVPAEHGEAELLDVCAGIWGIRSRRARELGVAFRFWRNELSRDDEGSSAGSPSTLRARSMLTRRETGNSDDRESEAADWADRVIAIMQELADDVSFEVDEEQIQSVRRGIADVHLGAMSILLGAIRTIYPSRNYPPRAPSPSCITLINALYSLPSLIALLPKDVSSEAWLQAADELRAGAVGDYVRKTQEFLSDENIDREGMLKGFEQTADWMENQLKRVAVAWPRNCLPGRIDPPAVILSKQLPLFFAELQVLEAPREGSKAEDIFGLYERTARLTRIWDELCPDQETGFDLDAFFEPHVREWLKGTEEVETHEWVNRAVGMDSWVPEGQFRHSQSVIDLFQFIRRSAKTVLTDLPLGEYSRACYVIDFSKSASLAIQQYAVTVQSLFAAEISSNSAAERVAEQPAAVSGKANAWLAKSKQAVKNLERKKVEGFVLPPTACVKLTDMVAAKASTEDLMIAISADETARVVREHKLRVGGVGKEPDRPARYLFAVDIARGENLLGKGLVKPADAFVTLHDVSTSTRVHKTGTVIGRLDPQWNETTEVSISTAKQYEVSCWDRLLVGKHELIGKAVFKLDPLAFKDHPSRDIVLPLNPRGTIHLRIEMQGGEKHEARFHLNRAIRSLDRAADDMTRKAIDKMSEFIRTQLSQQAIAALLKPLGSKAKKGAAKPAALSEQDIEQSLMPLFDYFDQVFSVFAVTLPDDLKISVMLQIWRRVLDILISLVIPPLSDKEATNEALSAQEIYVVFQWLKLAKAFFNAAENGQEHGVPMALLQGGLYKELILIGQYLDLPTPALKERCVASIKAVSRNGRVMSPTTPAQSALAPTAKTADEDERTAEILLRILRMRPQTSDFLGHSITQLSQARMQRQGGI